jgi:multiple sugar transport system permease protein
MDRAAKDKALLDRIGIDQIARNARARRRGQLGLALVFMSPALILVVGVLLVPVLFNIWLSFTKWKKFTGFGEYAGFANYERMPGNPFFNEALINTAIWVGASVVFPIALGLGMAMFFRNLRGAETFKNIIFIPRILAPTAVGVLWFYVYAPDGLLNRGLGLVSGRDVDIGWLYSDATVTPAIIATFVWPCHGVAVAWPGRDPEGSD